VGAVSITPVFERSSGLIPFRRDGECGTLYLVIHSATVRDPLACWEFPKGGVESGENARGAAAREFVEETGITSWAFFEGFQRSVSYIYLRQGRKRFKTVTYFLGEVFDASAPVRSHEHNEDPTGRWFWWGSFEQTQRRLFHIKTRRLFSEADAWLREQSGLESLPPTVRSPCRAATDDQLAL
jgi:bis(5'-nucleosidyl)-tetraphosphatase